MISINRSGVAFVHIRAVGCATAALAAARGSAITVLATCLAALAPVAAKATVFQKINDPAQLTTPIFTNLLGINNSGLIAGFYGSGAAGDPNTGFLLTLPNTFTPDNFPPPFVQSQMTGLNDTGIHTGYTYPTNNGVPVDNQFGFYEKGGVFTMVNNPKTPTSPPSGILIENQLLGATNKDLAVGFYNSVGTDASGNHPVSHGYTVDISTPTQIFSANIDDPNASLTNGGTVAAAINNSDEIAGFYTDAGGVIHGFLDNGGVFTTVDVPGASETELLGLNDHGMAVGFYVVNGVNHGVEFNSFFDVFTTIDAPQAVGGTGTTLNGLNDLNQIVGFYGDAAGNTNGLLVTGIPETSTWAMMLAGFAGLGLAALRRPRKAEVASLSP